MLLTILVVIVLIAIHCGGLGNSSLGLAGWSPLGIILAIILVLWLLGKL